MAGVDHNNGTQWFCLVDCDLSKCVSLVYVIIEGNVLMAITGGKYPAPLS